MLKTKLVRSERREQKKRNARKMKVSGAGVKKLRQLQVKKPD